MSSVQTHINFQDITEEEWLKKLPYSVFSIVRLGGTEAPFSGHYNDFYEQGHYVCVCCKTLLFLSSHKFNAGCGWPSFYEETSKTPIKQIEDNRFDMERIEIKCPTCDAHLGHLFFDGPHDTKKRYCLNSASLTFIPE